MKGSVLLITWPLSANLVQMRVLALVQISTRQARSYGQQSQVSRHSLARIRHSMGSQCPRCSRKTQALGTCITFSKRPFAETGAIGGALRRRHSLLPGEFVTSFNVAIPRLRKSRLDAQSAEPDSCQISKAATWFSAILIRAVSSQSSVPIAVSVFLSTRRGV